MGPPVNRRSQQDESHQPADEPEDDDYDDTDSPHGRRPVRRRTYQQTTYRRGVSTVDEVMEEATGYVTTFIADRMDRDGYNVPDDMRASCQHVKKETAKYLQRIGDDLVNNQELNALFDRITVTKDSAFETFSSIAADIFDDNEVNWGRIVTVFYLGYKLLVKALFEGNLLKTIVKWILQFISGRIVTWIANSGGWDTCMSYLGSTSAQMIGVFLAGCALTALVFWMKKS